MFCSLANLSISFSSQSNTTGQAVDGILLCVPIYESNTPDHNEYLTQLIDPDMPKCNYTEKEGVSYTAGEYKRYICSNPASRIPPIISINNITTISLMLGSVICNTL